MLKKLPYHILSMDQLQTFYPLHSQCHRIFWTILLKWRLFQHHFLWDIFIFFIITFSIYVGLWLNKFLRLHIHWVLNGSNDQILRSTFSCVTLHRFYENFSSSLYFCFSTSPFPSVSSCDHKHICKLVSEHTTTNFVCILL